MMGQFELYYQTANGQRLRVPGTTPWVGTLASGQATPALAEPPNTASKVVAVFLWNHWQRDAYAECVRRFHAASTQSGRRYKSGAGFEEVKVSVGVDE